MKCKNCSDRLTFYIQNELPQGEADEITNHLKSCDNCKSIEKELSALLQDISLIKDVEPTVDFVQTLTLKAEKELWNGSSSLRSACYRKYVRYSSIAAIFVICIVSVFIFNSSIGLNSKADKQMAASTAMNDNIKTDARNNGNEAATAASKKKDDVQPEPSMGGFAGSAATTAEVAQQNDQFVYDVSKEVQKADENVEKSEQRVNSTEQQVQFSENNEDGAVTAESIILPTIAALPTPTPSAKPLPALTTPATVKHIELLTQKLEIKSKNADDALAWIRGQISKVNGKEITILAALDQSTKASSTTTSRKAAADAKNDTATNETITINKVSSTITVEVKGDCEEQFTKAMKEYFGEKNIQFEVIENVAADTYRYIINVSE